MAFLDIFKKDQQPPTIVRNVEEMFDDMQDISRSVLEQVWWRNILYYCGEQHIEWMRSTKTFRRRVLADPGTASVSNEIREYVRSVKASLINQKLVPRIVPNTNDRSDQDAAEIGRKLLIWMDTLNDSEIEDEKEKVIIWLAVAGTAFMRTVPDKEGGAWFMQKDGTVLKTGDVAAYNVIPFNVRLDTLGDNLRLKRWVGIKSLVSKEWVEDTFKVTGLTSDNIQSLDYQKRLLKLVTQVSPWKGYGMESGAWEMEESDLLVLREVEYKPYKGYPNGRYQVVAGGKLLVDVDRMPIAAEQGKWYYSITDFHFNYVPGRFWSDGGVDDLISPQNSINEIDNSLRENRRTMGRPTVIMPAELSMKRLSERGDHVLVLTYDGRMAAGARPIISQGVPLPDQTVVERGLHKTQIQEMSGDPKNVLKGQAPSAHASGIMTDTLRETAEQGHYPDRDRFNRSMERTYRKRLLIAKEIFTEERTVKAVGKGTKTQVFKFKASDLRNNTDVRLEVDSGLATTQAGQREVLNNAVDKGLFGDISQQPEVRQELLLRYGFSDLVDKTSVDIDRAERENSMIEAGELEGIKITTFPVTLDAQVVHDDPLFIYDNHPVHYDSHRKQMMVAEYRDWPTDRQAALLIHTANHRLQMGLEQQQQVQQMSQMTQATTPQSQQPQQSQPSQGPPISGKE